MIVLMKTGTTVRLYYGGPLWVVLHGVPDCAGATSVICVRKGRRQEIAIYRMRDLVRINGADTSLAGVAPVALRTRGRR
ncbi:protein of unknown function [Paraburkholderia kururiensis]